MTAPNTLALYNFENDVKDYVGGYDLTINGAMSYKTSAPSPQQGMYSIGTFTAGGSLSAPAGLMVALNGLTAWSFQAWVYSIGRIPNRYLIASDLGGVDAFKLIVGDAGSDNGRFSVDATLGLQWTNPADFTGAWHHWAVVGKTAGREIWVDGAKVAFDSTSGVFPHVDTMKMGVFTTVATELNAYVDQIRFSNAALTSFPTTDPVGNFALLARRRGRI